MDSTVDIAQHLRDHRVYVSGNELGVDGSTMVLVPNEIHVHQFLPAGAYRIRVREGGIEASLTIAFDDLRCFAAQLQAFVEREAAAHAGQSVG